MPDSPRSASTTSATVATALADSGTPGVVTSRMLGHSSVAFTLDTYTHVDDEQIERAAQVLEQAFGGQCRIMQPCSVQPPA